MGRAKAKPQEKPTAIDGIPTAYGLTLMGRQYAYPVQGGIHITIEGQALINGAQRERALDNLKNGRWHGTSGTHDGPPRQPGV